MRVQTSGASSPPSLPAGQSGPNRSPKTFVRPGKTVRPERDALRPYRTGGPCSAAAGDRRDDRHLDALRGLGVQAVGEPDVLVAHVDVDEAADGAAVVEDAGLDARVVGLQVGQHLLEGGPLGRHLGLPLGVGAQNGRNADTDAHRCGLLGSFRRGGRNGSAPQSSPASLKARSDGLIVAVTPVPDTALSVLRPSPVFSTTVSASGSSVPAASSLRSTPVVTPPAVSAKMPSVRASSRIESTISGSLTCSTAPPVRRQTSSTYGPSAGLPMASDLAMVSGLTGWITSWPFSQARATGEHPVACAPKTRYGLSSTRPSPISSWKPLSILVSWEPETMGRTIWSGRRSPSCSAIS